MQIAPHLHFSGNCAEAFKFYETLFGGQITFSMTLGQSPMAAQSPPETHDMIMHMSLQVGDWVLLGADAPPQFYTKPQGFSVTLSIDDPAEADRLYAALSEGGAVRMELQETFWAHKFAMVTDRFGSPWMINCAKPVG
jgi:PhnB protein